MKILITILFLFIGFFSVGQSADSLKKYTYYIAAQQPINDTINSALQGTGFFVRDNGRLFLVTAKHVLTGCQNKLNDTCTPPTKPQYYPDFANVYLTKDGTPTSKSIFLDIRIIKDTANCASQGLNPDIIVCEVQNNTGDTIYSIEKFLNNKIPKKKGDISIYGFPSKTIPQLYGFIALASVSHLPITNYKLVNNYSFIGCKKIRYTDSINYVVIPKDSIDYNLYGYSGSPVFIFDKKQKKWNFIGVFTATADTLFLFCKPLFIKENISRIR